MPITRKLGWKPDVPDARDRKFSISHLTMQDLPPKTDLSPLCPPVWDQGELGCCTGESISGAYEFTQKKENPDWDFQPAPMFIYYNERVVEGTIEIDSGAMIRTGMKVVASQGVCSESLWPLNPNKFTIKPTDEAYANAAIHRTISYERVNTDLYSLKGCLAAGFPFVFGFSVYESFMSSSVAQTGDANMPRNNERMMGGHAVLCVGYDDETRRFLIRNSWGPNWGKQGYFTLPYEYITNANLADDFWTLRDVTDKPA